MHNNIILSIIIFYNLSPDFKSSPIFNNQGKLLFVSELHINVINKSALLS